MGHRSVGRRSPDPLNYNDLMLPDSVPMQISRHHLCFMLCDRAQPGRVLVSDVVRQLVAGKGFEFEHHGAESLKGFDEPVSLYEVRIGR
jgi:hypothetical protein